jgi:hypothetical protein
MRGLLLRHKEKYSDNQTAYNMERLDSFLLYQAKHGNPNAKGGKVTVSIGIGTEKAGKQSRMKNNISEVK